MTERTKVLVLKTSEAQASVGSNPTPSAKCSLRHIGIFLHDAEDGLPPNRTIG